MQIENLKNNIVNNWPLWKKIIKCTIAYEIGSIIILIPAANQAIGNVPYLLVLGTLFFNASGTAGNQIVEMILNLAFQVPSAIYCGIISYLCTLYNKNAETNDNLYSNGVGFIAAFAFFVWVFLIAYYRLKYPRLFIPSIQGFIVTFFCLTKGIYSTEFKISNILGVFYPVLIGGVIALVVNLLFWPETAAKVMELSFCNALSSIQNVLEFVQEEVLKEADNNGSISDLSASAKLRHKIKTLDSAISKMELSRKEAKYEIVISHYKPVCYKQFAKTMVGMSRNLYGLSLAIERESQIITNQRVHDQLKQHRGNKEDGGLGQQSNFPTSIDDKVIQEGGTFSRVEYSGLSRLQSSIQPEVKNFIKICNSKMKHIYRKLEESQVIPTRKTIPKQEESSQNMDKYDIDAATQSFRKAKLILQREYEETRSVPTEDHFLVFTMLLSLRLFGEKLVKLDKQADLLITQKHGGRFPRVFFPSISDIRKWLVRFSKTTENGGVESEQVIFGKQEILKKEGKCVSAGGNNSDSIAENNSSEQTTSSKPLGVENSTKNIIPKPFRRVSIDSTWIGDCEEQIVPLQNMPGKHFYNRWLYSMAEWFKTDPTRYAIKYTITMELLALMAWLPIPGSNALYNNNHGQWGLLSGMIVFNFTVGSTILQCWYRILATILSAIAGYICLLAANRNERPYVIAILTLVFQIPMWYTLLGTKRPRIGFVALLTLPVITSTGYLNQYQETVFDPVWKRTITSIFAVILVMLVNQLLWPVWARKSLRRMLSELLIRTGIQYSKVASLLCQDNTQSLRYKSTLADAEAHSKLLKQQLQLTTQMLGLAAMEPRITKAPFPMEIYRELLDREEKILYWTEQLLKVQALISPRVRKTIMNPMNVYRKELASAVHLYLYTLACSLRTKSALPATLPSAETARKNLLSHQADFWDTHFNEIVMGEGTHNERGDATGASKEDTEKRQEQSAENQIYWQTYAAGTVEVIVEQEAMGKLIAKLMGQYVFKAATRDWNNP